MIRKYQKKSLFFIIIASFSLFCPALSLAQPEAIAQVVWVKGTMQSTSADNKSRNLQRRDNVFAKETISTDKNSSGQLVFSDGAQVSVAPGSSLRIDDYKFNKANHSEDKTVISVAKGGFRTVTGAITKENPESYQINTPVATLGVRGTKFYLFFAGRCGKRDVLCGTYVKAEEHSVEVKNAYQVTTLIAGTKNSIGHVRTQESRIDYIAKFPSAIDYPLRIQKGSFSEALAREGITQRTVERNSPAGREANEKYRMRKASGVADSVCIY